MFLGKKHSYVYRYLKTNYFVLFLKKKATDNEATFSCDYLRHAGDKSCY